MSYLYYIAPAASDSEFLAKRTRLLEITKIYKLGILFPSDARGFKSVDSILEDMERASVIVVDISFARPSVYFELGLAATTKQSIAIIAGSGTIIHQTPFAVVDNFYTDLESYTHLLNELLAKHFERGSVAR